MVARVLIRRYRRSTKAFCFAKTGAGWCSVADGLSVWRRRCDAATEKTITTAGWDRRS